MNLWACVDYKTGLSYGSRERANVYVHVRALWSHLKKRAKWNWIRVNVKILSTLPVVFHRPNKIWLLFALFFSHPTSHTQFESTQFVVHSILSAPAGNVSWREKLSTTKKAENTWKTLLISISCTFESASFSSLKMKILHSRHTQHRGVVSQINVYCDDRLKLCFLSMSAQPIVPNLWACRAEP